MKVLFLKDVPGVALGGDVKEVKNGYARNYLIPYNIAVLANDESMKHVEKIKVESEKERIALMEDLKASDDVVVEILNRYPDQVSASLNFVILEPIETKENILHVLLKRGRQDAVKTLMEKYNTQNLLFSPDIAGNIPLTIANTS